MLGSSKTRWVARKENRHWDETAAARLRHAIVVPDVASSFRLSRSQPIFTIGSCFARNIENHLIAAGYRVVTRPIQIPGLEYEGSEATVVLNKFTTHSMLNELRWALEEGCPFPESSIVEEAEGKWVDLQVVPEVAAAERAVVLSRRPHIRRIYERVRECQVIILTLGLVEAWFDEEAGVFLNRSPGYWAVRRQKGRFSLHVLDYAANMEALEKIRELLVRNGPPGMRIVVTVSPVPMSETFSGRDVLVANAYSKSTLRAVAEDLARAHDDVDYFPSYETVTMSDRRVAYQDDLHHVADPIVDVIVKRFLARYADGKDVDGAALERYVKERITARGDEATAENAELRSRLGEVERERDELRSRMERASSGSERHAASADALLEDGSVLGAEGRCMPRSRTMIGSVGSGAREGDELVISGWVVDRRDPLVPAGVVVFVNGLKVAHGVTSLPRPDVDAALKLTCRGPGFRLVFPVPPQDITSVRVFGVSRSGEIQELSYSALFRLPQG